ncbi:hydroxymethylbilane synthase [Proteinivorax tanatarense]|uniref:Porphobilinogen deaminase n=1 Tax=Proteinivorax tanatarense TaxID=1260629 RepID=A0AAU7VJV1_9FIRM
MTRTIKVGSRKSELAIIQSEIIINLLKRFFPQYKYEIVTVTTKGDQILNKTLSKIGGKGLFVKEIQELLLSEKIDMAVHSMKDMPQETSNGLMISSMPKREDPRDVLIFNSQRSLKQLPEGGIIGTSSLRRQSQILKMRNDLKTCGLRGNVKTRLRKLYDQHMDGVILAAAGLNRLGITPENFQVLNTKEFVPAVGQGAIGCEIRQTDNELNEMLQTINDYNTFVSVMGERSFLQTLQGGCHAPIGCFGKIKGDELHLHAMVGSSDGNVFLYDEIKGEPSSYLSLGEKLGEKLAAKGAKEILKAEDGV